MAAIDTNILRRRQWIAGSLKDMFIGQMPEPAVHAGPGAIGQIGTVAASLGCRKMLVVSDSVLSGLGLVAKVERGLAAAGVDSLVFDRVEPNVPSHLVEEGLEMYKSFRCDGIVAVGGGSPMDCAKLIGACVCNPKKPLGKLAGTGFTVANRDKTLMAAYPPLIAVPTTAGTGSETSVAAVFLHDGLKKIVTDPVLVPRVAVLDPDVTLSLPKHITAATGMDALTHAVESYLSTWANARSRQYSLRAVDRIGRSLLACYHHGDDRRAREQMLWASFEAGVGFTNVSVGYVHAIAHTLGAFFGVPHGAANAAVLPHVLDFYLANGCDEAMSELAVAIGAVTPYADRNGAERRALAASFISTVRAMNDEMGIVPMISAMTTADVERVTTRALAEAHGAGGAWEVRDVGYPVPAFMTYADCEKVVRALLPGGVGSEGIKSKI
eukprot:m.23344 g.23344  ORF g.23344 m.23344 type:complete len:439 (+) comp10962_c0_seq2:153-1469(+)